MAQTAIVATNGAAEDHAVVHVAPASAAMTPMQMLSAAIERGADMGLLEKLMDLQERWQANEARKAFDEAIAQAKAEIKPVVRNATGHNNKKYADFAAIAREVDPVLGKYSLTYRFRSSQVDGKISVTCRIAHKAGHAEETTLFGPADTSGSKNAIQAIGSTCAYLQRYTLVLSLGLAAAHDDDGAASGAAVDVISDEQADILRDLITTTGTDLEQFLTYAKAPSVSDVLAKDFPRLKAMLETKQAKKGD